MTSPTRKTLAALQTMRGYLVQSGDSYRPERVSTGYGEEERTWVRVEGVGLGALFEERQVGHGAPGEWLDGEGH